METPRAKLACRSPIAPRLRALVRPVVAIAAAAVALAASSPRAQAAGAPEPDRVADADGARPRDARLQALLEKGRRCQAAGDYEGALVAAGRMLQLAPGNKDALALEREARQGQLTGDTFAAHPLVRRTAAEDPLSEAKQELSLARPDAWGETSLAAADPRRQAMQERLARTVSIQLRDVPLREAARRLAAVGGLRILLEDDVNQDAPVSLDGSSIPLGSAVRWLARLNGLHCSLGTDAVVLSVRPGSFGERVERSYDIAALSPPPRSLAGPKGSGADPGLRARMAKADPAALAEGWMRCIRTTIAPGTWGEPGEGAVLQQQRTNTIAYRGGRIVVVHTPEVHEQIQQLLDNFRESLDLQVHIKGRFITLTKLHLDSILANYNFDTLDQTPDRRYRVSGSVTPQPEVSALSRFAGFDTSGGLEATFTYLGKKALTVFLSAVLKSQRSTVLASPSITCFNTQRASIQVLTNHNYVRRVSTDNEPEIGNVPEGIVFDVQPFVSGDRRYITLVLQPQARELVGPLAVFSFSTEPQTIDQGNVTLAIFQETYIQIPTTRLRSLGTTVTVPDGGTLLVGGLTEVEEHAGVATVPFLGDLPVLRTLLRGWDRNEGRRVFMFLVTAEIVPDVLEQ